MTRREAASSINREDARTRWRAFILPHWPRLKRDVLTHQEATVLSLRLGLHNDRQLALRVIGQRFDCSQSRIQKIEADALTKVRAALQVKQETPDGTS